ncbi:MAG: SGNH/GDSL hydrolase family protein [Xanthomonadaceae bacterium]|nr:SGNH/GDSL hydrolase family protein [Xanthomonadaceae bacterium]
MTVATIVPAIVAITTAANAAIQGGADEALQRRNRYLALGDSYTIGEGVDAADRWPMQLVRQLRDAGIAIDDPRIIATTGWTTDELSAALDAAEPLGKDWALVSLLIGVNNQYRGRPVDDYVPEFTALLDRAIAYAGGDAKRVLVLSIPDWGVTPFAFAGSFDPEVIAEALDAYNAAAARICADRGVAFVDITPVSRARGADTAMLVEDALHPSAAMYAEWTALALPVAQRRLNEAKTEARTE